MCNRRTPDPRQGVFSTMLVVDGAPIALDAHLARLAASVRALHGAELPAATHRLARERAHGHALGRLRVTAQPDDAGRVRVDARVEPVERAEVLPGAAGAIDLTTVTLDDWPAAHKWVDRAVLAAAHEQTAPALPLLVGRDGAVRETIRGNLFVLGADGALRTPPADGSILPGVGRAELIALARELGVAVREAPLSLAELSHAREAFATNAVRGIEPVRSIDGLTLPDQAMAPALTGELAERWFWRKPTRNVLRH
ncbi:MAG: aminotransferase class IV [Actinobacteria bacterium]|nr:aminotransferase class IV [Actinomycetota bacterium]